MAKETHKRQPGCPVPFFLVEVIMNSLEVMTKQSVRFLILSGDSFFRGLFQYSRNFSLAGAYIFAQGSLGISIDHFRYVSVR